MLNHGKKQQQYKRGLHRGHHQKLIRTTLFSALFRQFAILSEIIKLIALAAKQDKKACYLFLKFIQINYIFSTMYLYHLYNLLQIHMNSKPYVKFVVSSSYFIFCYFKINLVMMHLRLILIFGVLMPLSAIYQLYHGDQF
jgi:hypothetical protein